MKIVDRYISIFLGIASLLLVILLQIKNEYIPFLIAGFVLIIYFQKFKYIMIFFLIMVNESFFYLLEKTTVLSEAIIVSLTGELILITFFKVIINKNNKCFTPYFRPNIILFSIIPVFSGMAANFSNQQQFFFGFISPKKYFIYLLYFYLIASIHEKKDIIKLENMMIFTSVILAIAFFMQAILGLNIFHVTLSESRTGAQRFYEGYTFIMLSYLICLSKVLDVSVGKIKTILYSSICLLDLLSIVIVSQTRNFILSIAISTFIVFVCQKKYKKLYLIILGIFFTCIYMIFNFKIEMGIKELAQSTIYEITNSVGSIGFRMREIQFYLDGFFKHPLMGVGYFSDAFSQTDVITGLNQRFYVDDVGIIGYIFNTGIIGIIIFVVMISNLLKFTIILREQKNSAYNLSIGLITFLLTGIVSTFYISDNKSILYVTIIISILECYYKDFKEKSKGINYEK